MSGETKDAQVKATQIKQELWIGHEAGRSQTSASSLFLSEFPCLWAEIP